MPINRIREIIYCFVLTMLLFPIFVSADTFPENITNIYELRDVGTLEAYDGPKRPIADGTNGYYLGTDEQFLPYKVLATEVDGESVKNYDNVVYCTLFGQASPAQNSFSVLYKNNSAPSQCTKASDWDEATKAGVASIIGTTTRFYGNELTNYYDNELAINKFLYDLTENKCNIEKCSQSTTGDSDNAITNLSQSAQNKLSAAEAIYDSVKKYIDKGTLAVSFPNDKILVYNNDLQIWKSASFTVNNYSDDFGKTIITLKDSTGKEYNDYVYLTNISSTGYTAQIGVCNSNDANDYCKKISNFTPLQPGEYTVDVSFSEEFEYAITENYNCGSDYQSVVISKTTPVIKKENATDSFTFTIEEHEEVGQITIKKLDSATKTGLTGAHITIMGPNNYNKTKILDTSSTLTLTELEYGTYTIKEFKAPEGYEKDTKEYKVILSETNKEDIVSIYNTKIETKLPSFTILKVDEDGKPLEGSIFKKVGTEDEFLVTKDGKIFVEQPIGEKMCFEEIEAPEGYKSISVQVCLRLTEDGKINLENNYDFVEVYESGIVQGIKIKNIPKEVVKTIVKIKKVDSEDKNKFVEGAKLHIIDKSGKEVISPWVSTKEDKIIEDLPVGIYYIEEIEAPEGYSLKKDKYEFEIKYEGQQQTLEFVNDKLVKVPDTLSNLSIALIMVGLIGLSSGSYLVYKTVKERNNIN